MNWQSSPGSFSTLPHSSEFKPRAQNRFVWLLLYAILLAIVGVGRWSYLAWVTPGWFLLLLAVFGLLAAITFILFLCSLVQWLFYALMERTRNYPNNMPKVQFWIGAAVYAPVVYYCYYVFLEGIVTAEVRCLVFEGETHYADLWEHPLIYLINLSLWGWLSLGVGWFGYKKYQELSSAR